MARKAKAAASKAAATKTTTTVTLRQIAASLAQDYEIPRKQAEVLFGDFVALTARHLKRGEKVRINGLGILQVRKRAARMGRNPATGESIKIRASKKVAFRVARDLKESI